MKLRNKKTGEIVDLWRGTIASDMNGDNITISSMKPYEKNIEWSDREYQEWSYHSLAELNEEWEDYTPAEPKRMKALDEVYRKICEAKEHSGSGKCIRNTLITKTM